MATARQIQCFTLFEAQGYPPESAAAWVGNFSQESGTSLPSAFRSGVPLDHGSQGLEQWRLDRLTNYENFVKAKVPGASDAELWAYYGNMAYQVEFATQECRRDYPSVELALHRGGDIAALTALICWQVERPSLRYANLANRVAQAKNVFAAAPHLSVPPSTVSKANTAVIKHTQAATGAVVAAGGSTIGAAATIATHVQWHMPSWAWILAGTLGVVIVMAIISAITNAVQAGAAKNTLVAATPVVAPASVPAPASAPTPAPIVAATPPKVNV